MAGDGYKEWSLRDQQKTNKKYGINDLPVIVNDAATGEPDPTATGTMKAANFGDAMTEQHGLPNVLTGGMKRGGPVLTSRGSVTLSKLHSRHGKTV